MNKLTSSFILITTSSVLLSGCSSFLTDHADDYQNEIQHPNELVTPEGSAPLSNALIIPNEDRVADLTEKQPFVAPRAPFLYQSMAKIDMREAPQAISYIFPADIKQAQKIIEDFVISLHSDENMLANKSDNRLTTTPIPLVEQGKWRALWSKITRVYPSKTEFAFDFSRQDNGHTLVTMQMRQINQDDEAGEWLSPAEDLNTYAIAVKLWGTIGRKLDQSSAYLSDRKKQPEPSPVWVNSEGMFAAYLGQNVTQQQVEEKIKDAGLFLMSDANQLAAVAEQDIARIGDVVALEIPVGNGKTQKLFNVRRRDLDDVSWQERVYAYHVERQATGDFLVIDVSATQHPQLTSYYFAKKFIN